MALHESAHQILNSHIARRRVRARRRERHNSARGLRAEAASAVQQKSSDCLDALDANLKGTIRRVIHNIETMKINEQTLIHNIETIKINEKPPLHVDG